MEEKELARIITQNQANFGFSYVGLLFTIYTTGFILAGLIVAIVYGIYWLLS